MSKPYTSSTLIGKDLGRSLYCCFLFFAIIINPLRYLPISGYYRVSLDILILGLACYPLFVKGKTNYFTANYQTWTFQFYALLICGLSITAALIFKIFDALA